MRTDGQPYARHSHLWLLLALGAGMMSVAAPTAPAQTNLFPASGNVGIGTTNPEDLLQVSNPGGASSIGIGSEANGHTYGHIYTSADTGGYFAIQSVANSGTSYGSVVLQRDGGSVGIGTTTPAADLDVGRFDDGGALRTVFARQAEGNAYGSGTFLGVRAWTTQSDYNGEMFSIEDTFYGQLNSSIDFYRGGGYTGGFMTFTTNNGTERMRIASSGNVGIGTTSPAYPLSVNGTIQAKEVIVQSGWSDYVFGKNYKLAPLSKVERTIETEHHLPGMPSANDVAQKGVSLGDMQAKLLAQVEELTLRLIEQDKRGRAQEEEIAELRARNSELAAKVSDLKGATGR